MSQRWLRIALAAAVALAGAVTAGAADTDTTPGPSDSDVSQRLASLEAEVQRLGESPPQAPASNGTLLDPAAPTGSGWGIGSWCGPRIGQDFFNYRCRTGGVVAGVEMVFLKPFYTAGGAPNVDAAASDPVFGFVNYPAMPYNFTAAPRFWFGYAGTNGLGGRFRFFEYNQTAANDVSVVFGAPPGIFTQTGSLSLHTYDLELTQQVNFRYWSFQAFGGLRYAQAIQQSNVDVVGFSLFNSRLSYNGTGLTGGLQGERVLTSNGRWSMFFAGRGSFLFGNERDNTSDQTGLYTEGNRSIRNVFASIWELNIGPQWKMHLPCGGDFFVRASAEAQYWQGVGDFAPIGTSPLLGLNHNDNAGGFGLLGFAGTIGITR